MSRESDFSTETRRQLAARAGYRCSCPDCRAPTSGPQLGGEKSVNAGDAAHITAASESGPRFDPSLTPEQRKHYDNGIWLCVIHARIVDQDSGRYTVNQLRTWKRDAENLASQQLGKPPTPHTPSTVNAAVFLGPNAISISGPNAVSLGPNAIRIVGPVVAHDDSAKRHAVEKLAEFLIEAQNLRQKLMEASLPVQEHNDWVDRVAGFLKSTLGSGHEVRFGDFSGMVFFGDGSERSKLSRSLDGRSRRVHEFMSELSS